MKTTRWLGMRIAAWVLVVAGLLMIVQEGMAVVGAALFLGGVLLGCSSRLGGAVDRAKS
jgi:hypothetical protein